MAGCLYILFIFKINMCTFKIYFENWLTVNYIYLKYTI